jgi:hypothetical protein
MRRTLTLICGTALMTLALLVPAGAASATPTTARHGNVFSFALVTPNTAVAPSGGMMAAPGDWIEVTGGGGFNPATGAVHAGGAFVHHNVDGTLACRGTWWATALTGWTDLSAARSRRHGGIVSMLVTHSCATTGEIHTGIPMTVTSTRNVPDGSAYVEGVTVGEFTQSTAGTVVIRARGRRS